MAFSGRGVFGNFLECKVELTHSKCEVSEQMLKRKGD